MPRLAKLVKLFESAPQEPKLTREDIKREREETRELAQFLRKGFEEEGFVCLVHGTHDKFYRTKCKFVKAPGAGNA